MRAHTESFICELPLRLAGDDERVLAGRDWGTQVNLATPLQRGRAEVRRLQRRIDRQQRANNPGNYLPDGRVRPGAKTWHKSHKQRQVEGRLAEALSRCLRVGPPAESP